MSWQIKDEWVDMAQGRHVVIYHNPEILVAAGGPKLVPQEHHLIHHFNQESCPHCGHVKSPPKRMLLKAAENDGDEPLEMEVPAVDFHKVKADTLEALNQHHNTLMAYRSQHGNVRIGSGPK